MLTGLIFLCVVILSVRSENTTCLEKCNCVDKIFVCEAELTDEDLDKLSRMQNDNVVFVALSNQNFEEIDLCKFKGFPKIKTFKILLSKLKKIPTKSKNCLTSLSSMDLSDNEISEIQPDAFLGYNQLGNIVLSNNKLSIIPAKAFKHLPTEIQGIQLSENRLSQISVDAFYGLKKIGRLYLAKNELSYISKDMLAPLEEISFLHLQENVIQGIQGSAFRDISILQIDLNTNNITTLELDAFKNSKISQLSISANPFKCSCSNLAAVIQGGHSVIGDCATPVDLKGNKITDVINTNLDPCMGLSLCKTESNKKIRLLRSYFKSRQNTSSITCNDNGQSNSNKNKKENLTVVFITTITVLVIILVISVFIAYTYRRRYFRTALVTSRANPSPLEQGNNEKYKKKQTNNCNGYIENGTDKDITLKTMRRKISQVVFGRISNPPNGLIPSETNITGSTTPNKPSSDTSARDEKPRRKRNVFHTKSCQPSINEETECDLAKEQTQYSRNVAVDRSKNTKEGVINDGLIDENLNIV